MKKHKLNFIVLILALVLLLAFVGVSFSPVWEGLGQGEESFQREKQRVINCFQRASLYPQCGQLFLGDSVARQLFSSFDEKQSEFVNMIETINATMAGQYLFCREFLRLHTASQGRKAVYLITIPDSLVQPFKRPDSYVYFLAPFAECGQIQNLDEETRACLRQLLGAPIVNNWVPCLLEKVPLWRYCYLGSLKRRGGRVTMGDDMPERWLPRILDMCRASGYEFHLLCCPLADSKQGNGELSMALERLTNIDKTVGSHLAEEYKHSVHYLPPELFMEDGCHFLPEVINGGDHNELLHRAFPVIFRHGS